MLILEKLFVTKGAVIFNAVPGREETARGMKTAAARIPGYEIDRMSKTGVQKLIQ